VERRQLGRGQPPLRADASGDGDAGVGIGRNAGFLRAAAPAATAVVAVVGTAATNGGYFPTDYGWAALGFLLLAAAAILVCEHVSRSRLDWLLAGTLCAFTAWVGLSALWSTSVAQPLFELERAIGYLAAAVVLLLITPKGSAGWLVGGLFLGITAVCAYALATRLFPSEIGGFDPETGYQLGEPIGYSNGLAILAAIGLLLALGFSIDARIGGARAVAAATLPILAATLYFTFSRGALLSLLFGAGITLVMHPRRLRLSVLGLIVLAPAALAVVLCSRYEALTHPGASLAEATRAGHRLAPMLTALVVGSALLGYGTARIEPRVSAGRRLRFAGAGILSAAAICAAAVLVVAVAQREQQAGPPADLNQRLASHSSSFRTEYWRVARGQFRDHPWLGTGAGSFERFWLERRPADFDTRDAHSLYLETLAELGPVGLLLVLGVLAGPVLAMRTARRSALGPAAAGAFAAFAAHAGIDWDWEVPSVTLAGLACGVALIAWARRQGAERSVSSRHRAGALAVVLPLLAFVFVMHVGNTALLSSVEALALGDADRAAAEARRATRWAPWSYEPWQRLGEVELARERAAVARVAFREAIERDRENWLLWYELAQVAHGQERSEALNAVRRLNPLTPEAAERGRPS
jgi:O-antigen ligase